MGDVLPCAHFKSLSLVESCKIIYALSTYILRFYKTICTTDLPYPIHKINIERFSANREINVSFWLVELLLFVIIHKYLRSLKYPHNTWHLGQVLQRRVLTGLGFFSDFLY